MNCYVHVAIHNVSTDKTVIVALSIVEIDRDLLPAEYALQDLKKEELKYLFIELGLNYLTVMNKYDSPLNVYRGSLLQTWIFKSDRVQEKGGPTWENLKAALEKRNHFGHAEKIRLAMSASPQRTGLSGMYLACMAMNCYVHVPIYTM